MTAFATADELKSFMKLAEVDETRADLLLNAVTDQIKTFTGQALDGTTEEEVKLDGSGTTILMLPHVPVTDVSLVKENGEELDEESWEWSADGMLHRLGNSVWVQRFRWYEVTYEHGLASVPESVKMLALRVAARGYVNPTGLTQEAEGGYSAAYGFDASRLVALSENEQQELRDFMAK